jgi:MFS family permease
MDINRPNLPRRNPKEMPHCADYLAYLREFGRFQRNARLYLLSNAISGIAVGIVGVLYNLYLASLGYGADFIGLVLFFGILGAGLAIFPAGICIDRFGGKLVQIWSGVALFFAIAGQLLFRQPLPLLLSSFLAGLAAAFQLVVNAPYLTQNSSEQERPHLFSFAIVVGLITTVLGELLGGVLPLWFRAIPATMAPLPHALAWIFVAQPGPRAYQLALLSASLFAIPSLIPVLLLSDDRPSTNSRGVGWLRPRPYYWFKSLSKQIRSLHIGAMMSSAFFLLVLFRGLIGLGAGLFVPYFNLYFVQHLHASPALFGLIDGGANTINALLTLLAPLLAARIGKIPTIALTQLLSIPLMLTIGLTPLLPLAAALYLFRQGAMDMSLGIFQVYSMEVVPQERRGVANSAYQAVFQGAEAVSTPLGGLLIAHVGYTPIFLVGAICYALATGLLWQRFKT